jgi:hypothetical protein
LGALWFFKIISEPKFPFRIIIEIKMWEAKVRRLCILILDSRWEAVVGVAVQDEVSRHVL